MDWNLLGMISSLLSKRMGPFLFSASYQSKNKPPHIQGLVRAFSKGPYLAICLMGAPPTPKKLPHLFNQVRRSDFWCWLRGSTMVTSLTLAMEWQHGGSLSVPIHLGKAEYFISLHTKQGIQTALVFSRWEWLIKFLPCAGPPAGLATAD